MGRKKPYNIGEMVRVVNPQVFVRCGYPLGISDGLQAVDKSHSELVKQMLQSIFPKKSFRWDSQDRLRHSYNKIMRELAVVWLKEKKFGGFTRSVHVEEDTRVLDYSQYEIMTIRYVRSGERDSGGSYSSMYPDDFEPPSLVNQKSHRILGLVESGDVWATVEFEIEDIHVEKIKE